MVSAGPCTRRRFKKLLTRRSPMEMLKILWFNWRCWLNPEMGGAEVFTYEVARRRVRARHQITLLTSGFFQNWKGITCEFSMWQ